MRTGDTPQRERQQMLRSAPDILITTPESLYLMLTGRAQELFEGARWCIIDEIHAVASTKRGSHLALTLERLTEAAGTDVQRDRAVGDAESAGGGRAIHGRSAAQLPDRRHRRSEGARPEDPCPGRVDGRARRSADNRARSARRRRGDPPFDLAGDLPRAGRADPLPQVDDPVRQQPPRRRAAGAAAQRSGGGGDRALTPRLARARGTDRRRGAAQGPASCRAWSRPRRWSWGSTWARSTS